MLSLFPLHPQWNQCAIAFLAHVGSISGSESTVRNYRARLQEFFVDVYKTPDDYVRSDVEKYLARPTHSRRVSGTPPSQSLRNARLTALNSFYGFASKWIVEVDGKRRVLLMEPPPTLGIVYSKKANAHHDTLAEEEVKRLFAVIPTSTIRGARDKAILLCYFWTARRRSEILRLRYGDIERGIVVDVSGQSRVGILYHFRGKGRGMEEDDMAELPRPAYDAIMRYLTVSGRIATIKPDDPLFVPGQTDRHGGKRVHEGEPISGAAVAWGLKRYAKAAGLDPEKVSIHSFRGTAAKLHYQLAPDVRAVQRLLRHSSLQTTSIYLEEITSTADPTAEKMMQQYGNL